MELALVRLSLIAFFAGWVIFGFRMFRSARTYAADRWGDHPPLLPQVFGYGLCLFVVGVGFAGSIFVVATIILHPATP